MIGFASYWQIFQSHIHTKFQIFSINIKKPVGTKLLLNLQLLILWPDVHLHLDTKFHLFTTIFKNRYR